MKEEWYSRPYCIGKISMIGAYDGLTNLGGVALGF